MPRSSRSWCRCVPSFRMVPPNRLNCVWGREGRGRRRRHGAGWRPAGRAPPADHTVQPSQAEAAPWRLLLSTLHASHTVPSPALPHPPPHTPHPPAPSFWWPCWGRQRRRTRGRQRCAWGRHESPRFESCPSGTARAGAAAPARVPPPAGPRTACRRAGPEGQTAGRWAEEAGWHAWRGSGGGGWRRRRSCMPRSAPAGVAHGMNSSLFMSSFIRRRSSKLSCSSRRCSSCCTPLPVAAVSLRPRPAICSFTTAPPPSETALAETRWPPKAARRLLLVASMLAGIVLWAGGAMSGFVCMHAEVAPRRTLSAPLHRRPLSRYPP